MRYRVYQINLGGDFPRIENHIRCWPNGTVQTNAGRPELFDPGDIATANLLTGD